MNDSDFNVGFSNGTIADVTGFDASPESILKAMKKAKELIESIRSTDTPDLILMTHAIEEQIKDHLSKSVPRAMPIELTTLYGVPFESFPTERDLIARAIELSPELSTFGTERVRKKKNIWMIGLTPPPPSPPETSDHPVPHVEPNRSNGDIHRGDLPLTGQ